MPKKDIKTFEENGKFNFPFGNYSKAKFGGHIFRRSFLPKFPAPNVVKVLLPAQLKIIHSFQFSTSIFEQHQLFTSNHVFYILLVPGETRQS
jgi:hypothetical protein